MHLSNRARSGRRTAVASTPEVVEEWGFACCPVCGHAWLAFICNLRVSWLPTTKETRKCIIWCRHCNAQTMPDVQVIGLTLEEIESWTQALQRHEFPLG